MKKVVMYTLSTCPWCMRAKKYFREHDIPFEYIDYDKADEKTRRSIMEDCKSHGEEMSFPFVKIGDDVVVGYNPQKYSKLLES
ncbi:glutaredoxin family protein [Methanolobus halotolerans]|uniref:NrdH-redoxin n=1 Tax=Methanolobus halotolerans TaxID=2052935 RepID=A0A4E0PWB7_9EURY|nr:glutaredoxin family protein [Methanolobus halotolerans]TGC09755.1 NrdH-redoxin [Methanolobus halotolerans]